MFDISVDIKYPLARKLFLDFTGRNECAYGKLSPDELDLWNTAAAIIALKTPLERFLPVIRDQADRLDTQNGTMGPPNPWREWLNSEYGATEQ